MENAARPLAVVTGASSGIGFELASCCVAAGYDLVIAADDPTIVEAAQILAKDGASVGSSRVDLQACKLEYSIVSPK